MTNNFLIGPIKDGLRKDIKPWATPEDSFDSLTNAYQWRGRVVRRPGYTLLGQLSFQITSQIVGASAQNFTANLFAVFSLSGVVIVSGFITITVNGAGDYTLTEDPNNPGNIIQTGGVGVAFLNGSINYLTGALALNFSANPGGNVVITFSYAFLLPVMGLRTRELFEINQQDTIAFDTMFSYRFSNTSNQFQPLPSVIPVTWHGANWQFFYTINYAGAFWATNSFPGLNGWKIQAFAASAGVGNAATVQVTSAGNNVQIGDFVYFVNLSSAVDANAAILAQVTVAGDPFTVQAVMLPTSTTPATFTWTNGVTVTGMVLDSQQSGMLLNGNPQDGIRYYAQTGIGTTWVNYNPPIDINTSLAGALLIFPYRGYLVFLNTTEGNDEGVFNFGNRARWTQVGTPYYSGPVPTTPNPQGIDINAARDDLFGKGGATDAPTQEVIVGAAFIKDILIVGFERSTWRLRFVNNAQNPFVWERINIELGTSATFSTIPFDKGLMSIGERGIVIADPNDVIRFDEKIPDSIFQIRIENDGMQRVYGIRTFRTKLNYWTYPSNQNAQGTFPDQVLVFNYDTKNWSFFDDCFTCFGYFYAFNDMTWGDLTLAWSSYGDITWDGGEIQQGYETIISGNQQGFVFKLEQTDSANATSLYITAISGSTFTSPNNNLPDGTWIKLSGIAGTTDISGVTLNGRSFKLVNSAGPGAQPNTFTLQEFTPFDGGLASGSLYVFQLSVPFIPIFPGSVYITVGTITFTDQGLNGILFGSDLTSFGSISYSTGTIVLNFVPALGSPTEVFIRVVSQNPLQALSNVVTTGTYTGGGYISKKSNMDIQTKIFNFLPEDKRSRLSKIDFYLDSTTAGEFTVDIFGDSSNTVINTPLLDNPRSNVVQTTVNPYQVGKGKETIYRLYCDAMAQTVQGHFYLSDQQMAVDVIQQSDIEILAMNFTLRRGGRLV